MLNLILSLFMFWPVLQMPPTAPYKELSKYWDPAGTIASGIGPAVGVAICPTRQPGAGHLIAADSAGRLAELRFDGAHWSVVRTFRVDEPVTAICSGAPHLDRVWRVYVGTRGGRILELNRGNLGWTTVEVAKVPGPIRNMQASDPGIEGISQLFVIDANGQVTNYWLTEEDKWVTRQVPEIQGGATEVCFDYHRSGLRAITAGPSGVIAKFTQDSTGHWTGGPWTTMPAGALDMTASADPTMQDIAVYYSGRDGIFRYLFHGRMDDEPARIAVAGGTTHLIGKGPQRRFNEFFAQSGNEFCLFEFNFTTRDWDKIVLKPIREKVVSSVFGPGRGESLSQVYAMTVDGTIHEFTRRELEESTDARGQGGR